MSMSYSEALEARRDADETVRNTDRMLRQTAALLSGRLKSSKVSWSVLCDLKRELSNYNMHTGEWRK